MSKRSNMKSALEQGLLKMRQNELLLRALLETTTDVFVILSLDGTIQYHNPAVQPVMGYEQQVLMGTNAREIVHPDDFSQVQSAFEACAQNHFYTFPGMEVRIRYHDGSWCWMRLDGKVIVDDEGNVLVAIHLRDISGAKLVEQNLHQRVDELVALQATVLDLTVQQDLISLLNSIVERIMTLLNSPVGFIYLFDQQTAQLELVIEKGMVVPLGMRIQLGEGMAGLVAQTRQPLIVDDYILWSGRLGALEQARYRAVVEVPMLFSGQLIGVMGASEDHTTVRTYNESDARILSIFAGQAANLVHNFQLFQEFQQASSERHKVEKALLVSEDRFRSIYENSTIGMYQTTPGGEILLCNSALVRMLGYDSFEELTQRNLQQGGYEPGYERKEFIEKIESLGEIIGLQSAWKRKNGSTIHVRESAKCIRSESGEILFYEGTVEDFTDQKRAETVQSALYRISEAAQTVQNLNELFILIHGVVEELMPAKNFYIALHDPAEDLIEFPYYMDEYDSAPPPQKMGDGLTEYVLRTGKSLLVKPDIFAELVKSGQVISPGAPSVDWLGVPLKTHQDITIGMMAVQTYSENERLVEEDKDILLFVSTQAAMAIERKRAENALKRVYENLSATLDALPDLMFELDANQRIYNFHAPQPEKLYVLPETFIGKKVEDVLPENAVREIKKALSEAKKTGVHHGGVYSLVTPAGLGWFELSVAVKGDANLNHGMFIVLVRDITERKRTEDALRESEERLRKAQTMAHVGNWELDLRDGKMWGSEEAFRIYGIERTLPYLPLEYIQHCVLPEYRPVLDQALKKLIASDVKYDEEFQINRFDDGALCYVHSKAEVIRNSSGIPQRVQGVIQDITDRKNAEDEIRRLNEELELRVMDRTAQLEAANRELESFSYSVSHDLRAPLRAIDGFSRIIQQDYAEALPADALRMLDSVRINAQQMNKLIEDLLKFSRLGRQRLNKQLIEPGDLVRQALDVLKQDQIGRKIDFELMDLPACQGDPSLLLQVWINLLSNALKYTRKNTVAHIKVGFQTIENSRAVYFVKDDGVGFDMQYSDKLFGVFQRLHNSEEFEGTGVGLALAQQIIMRHGGRIWAESQIGEGASFYFTV